MIKKINLAKNGFTLVEMLIALAISAIIIGAAFGSYTIISRNFEWQKDMKYMSQSARSVVEMITKDIRNAGFRFESSAAITDPVKIYDANDARDRIEIIYDETETPYKRVKIEYRLQQYSNDNSRFRLYKKKTNMTNNTVEYDSPIADYVEVLQFNSKKKGEDATVGPTRYGEGNKRWLTPDDIISVESKKAVTSRGIPYWVRGDICEDPLPHDQSNTGQPIFAVDGDPKTAWSYITDTHDCRFLIKFKNPMRVTKVIAVGPGGMGGGSEGNNGVALTDQSPADFSQISYPYGFNYPATCQFSFFPIPDGCIDNSGNCSVSTNYREFFDTSRNPVHYWDRRGWVGSHSDRFLGDEWSYPLRGDQDKALFQEAYVTTDSCNSFGYGNGISSPPTGHQTYRFPWEASWTERNQYGVLADIKIFGEVYGEPQIPDGAEIGLLIRSPNEHGNVDRSFAESIGDYSFSANDKYLRDTYVTSATMRNIYYQSP